jgi:hypothetical protein
MAVPHYTYLVLKMLGPNGIITVKEIFKHSDICDKEFHKMAQTFGMTAEYGQLNGKAEKATITTTKQPEEDCAEPEANNFESKRRTRTNLQQMSQGLLQPRRQTLKSN